MEREEARLALISLYFFQHSFFFKNKGFLGIAIGISSSRFVEKNFTVIIKNKNIFCEKKIFRFSLVI